MNSANTFERSELGPICKNVPDTRGILQLVVASMRFSSTVNASYAAANRCTTIFLFQVVPECSTEPPRGRFWNRSEWFEIVHLIRVSIVTTENCPHVPRSQRATVRRTYARSTRKLTTLESVQPLFVWNLPNDL